MVDAATPLIGEVASPERVAKWDEINRRSVPEAPGSVMLLDAFARIEAAAPLRELPCGSTAGSMPASPAPPAPQLPAVLLTADKLARDASALRRTELTDAHNRRTAQLGARHVTETASGHHTR